MVPPNQAEAMSPPPAPRACPSRYHFAGEGHGFRRAETVVAAYGGGHFFAQVFGFVPADDVPVLPGGEPALLTPAHRSDATAPGARRGGRDFAPAPV